MPQNEAQERYRWIKPVIDNVLTIKQMIKVCPFCERTLKYWLARFRKFGISGLASKSRKPHTFPNATPKWLRNKIILMRKHKRIGAKKMTWYLADENISVGERTIGKILNQEGLVRKYRKRNNDYWKPKPIVVPGKLVEIDIKYAVRLAKYRWFYQFTAIDKASRWRLLEGFDSPGNYEAICFLKSLIKKAPFQIKAVKTDNAEVFTNKYTGYAQSKDQLNPRLHPFDVMCNQMKIIHYLIDKGKPQQNGTVERSHRTDQETFYDYLKPMPKSLEEYRYYLKLWNLWYNDLKHCSLNGLSPNQYLKLWVQNVFT